MAAHQHGVEAVQLCQLYGRLIVLAEAGVEVRDSPLLGSFQEIRRNPDGERAATGAVGVAQVGVEVAEFPRLACLVSYHLLGIASPNPEHAHELAGTVAVGGYVTKAAVLTSGKFLQPKSSFAITEFDLAEAGVFVEAWPDRFHIRQPAA